MRWTAAAFVPLAILAVRVAAHGPAPEAPSADLPPAVRDAAATIDAFHAALKRRDTRAAAELVADDALIFEQGGVERSKAEYAAHHLSADARFSSAVSSVVTRRAGHSSGALAWVASEGRITGSFEGRAIDLVTTESMVLRRSGSDWRIVHIHWSSTAKP